jgi:hypothetical protein
MKTTKKIEPIEWRLVLTLAVAIFATRLLARYVLPQFDDSFIIMRYARNLAIGHGFRFNSDSMVLGVSCPLFGFLEALFFMLRLPMPTTVLILNIILDIFALMWGIKLLQQAEGRISSIIFGVSLALSPSLARITIGSMEVNLFLVLCLISISLFHARKTSIAIALSSITFFIREEAVLLVGILLALEFFRGSKMKALRLSLLSLLCIIPGLSLMYYYYGGIIPQSVLTKLGWHTPSFFYPLKLLFVNDPLGVVLLPFTVYGAWLALQKRGPIQTLVFFIMLLTLVYCGTRSFIMPWYGEVSHYAQFILAAFGIGTLLYRSTKISHHFDGHRLLYGGSIMTIAVWSFVAWKSGPSKVRTNIYDHLATWGQAHPLDSMSIMAHDIGAVGYYTGAKIYDLDGLVWPSEARKNPEGVVSTFKPTYLFLTRTKDSYELSRSPAVQESYILTMTFAQDSLEVPLAKAPEEWNQNYVLFERINK